MPNARPLWPVGINHHDETECCHPRCGAAPHPESRMPLCNDHLFKAAADFNAIFQPVAPRLPEPPPIEPPPRNPVVYFLVFGNRIKIGFSTDWLSRVEDLPYDETRRNCGSSSVTSPQVRSV